jgi:hypothetical protein
MARPRCFVFGFGSLLPPSNATQSIPCGKQLRCFGIVVAF